MKTKWIATNEIYHQMIAEADLERRTALYRQQILQPWQPMMRMMGGMMKADPADEFAVARRWAWLLPEQLAETPDALRQLEAANAWQQGQEAIDAGAARFAPYAEPIGFDHVTGWLMIADSARSDPIGRGYTGSIDWTQPSFVVQYDTPNDYNLPRLSGAVVHEMHHLIRLRLFPWDMNKTSVADYIVLEGLAESFATSLFGEEVVGYYVTDFNEDELATAKRLIHEGLHKTGFGLIRSHIFGDSIAERYRLPKIGMPDFGGYAIGYRVVQAYLQRTGKSIEEATFLPAQQIVQDSGFFEA